MRIYKTDGTFIENKTDIEFGWDFNDIEVINQRLAKVNKDDKRKSVPSLFGQLRKEESFMESVDIVEPEKPIVVKHIEVNVKTEPIVNVINCKMEVEGPPNQENDLKCVKQLKTINSSLPPKEELAKLINPCNIETRTLLSVIYFAKYKSLIKEETSAELFKTVNFKTTNFKCLIKDKQSSIQHEMIKDIQHYHATKEDNMLSLMMELILADMACNLGDIVDVDEETNSETNNSETSLETSDLGNSILSSHFSKDLSFYKTNYLNVPDRSSLLSSIGLSDEDKSLQSICEETFGMRLQTAEIKESFQEEENKVNELIKMTTALLEEVKETLYLEDILHLLKGDVEKVKTKKLPFRIFYKEPNNSDLNLII